MISKNLGKLFNFLRYSKFSSLTFEDFFNSMLLKATDQIRIQSFYFFRRDTFTVPNNSLFTFLFVSYFFLSLLKIIDEKKMYVSGCELVGCGARRPASPAAATAATQD
jgi:hypothetical protein